MPKTPACLQLGPPSTDAALGHFTAWGLRSFWQHSDSTGQRLDLIALLFLTLLVCCEGLLALALARTWTWIGLLRFSATLRLRHKPSGSEGAAAPHVVSFSCHMEPLLRENLDTNSVRLGAFSAGRQSSHHPHQGACVVLGLPEQEAIAHTACFRWLVREQVRECRHLRARSVPLWFAVTIHPSEVTF